ncbi:MAG: GTPase, partial [Planctomycetota bacterium]
MTARWRIATPRSRPAALAVIELSADTLHNLDTALMQAIGTVPAVGAVVLRPICGIDTGIAARLGPTHTVLMPHGGPAVLDGIASSLTAFGLEEATDPAPRQRFPEAESDIEAEMLAALSRAQSPLAVDLLLDQPRRWGSQTAHDREPNDRDRRLNRLIDPPLVAAAGPPNVGKSSLLNALAGRRAALVADE